MKQPKITGFRRAAALLLTLFLAVSPLGVMAETDFSAGDMLPTLLGETIAAGREIKATISAKVANCFALDAAALRSILDICEVELRYYDDFGTACVGIKVDMGGQTLITADARVEADGTVTLLTSLVPGKTLVLPAQWVKAQLGLEKTEAMQKLEEMRDLAYITYFYRLGGWVSQTQYWNEDLYVAVDEPHEATDARDEVTQGMAYRVRNEDFIYLLDSIAFHFRDNDHELQQAIADVLAERGVTRGQLREVVDTLFTREDLNGPEHWITRTDYLTEEQLGDPVNYDDMYYLATRMAYSVRTCMEEELDGATEWIVSDGTDYQPVGFDGTMPQMWKDFPFKNGALTFNRKTLTGEGVHYTAQGHMDLTESGYAVDGMLDFFRGEASKESRVDTYDIAMDLVRESDAMGFDAALSDDRYLDGDRDVREVAATVHAYMGEVQKRMSATLSTATWEIDEDFASEMSLNATLGESLEAELNMTLASGDYEAVTFPIETVNVQQASQEEMSTLQNELMTGLVSVMYTALSTLPAEAMSLLQ